MVVERYCLRRVHKFGHAYELLLTFGIAFIIAETVKLFFGPAPVDYPVPPQLRFAAFTIYGTQYPFYRVLMGAISVSMFIFLFGVIKFTRIGIIVRAAVHKPQMVNALGYNVPLVFMGVFGVGAALAGLAGSVAGAFYPTSPNMALDLGLIVFVVVVVGGLGSLEGAFLASMIIGLSTSFVVGINWCLADVFGLVGMGERFRSMGGVFTVELNSVAGLLPYAFMLIILVVRPAGLLGEKQAAL
jgi:branched-chain amino acid transport system permease protein